MPFVHSFRGISYFSPPVQYASTRWAGSCCCCPADATPPIAISLGGCAAVGLTICISCQKEVKRRWSSTAAPRQAGRSLHCFAMAWLRQLAVLLALLCVKSPTPLASLDRNAQSATAIFLENLSDAVNCFTSCLRGFNVWAVIF